MKNIISLYLLAFSLITPLAGAFAGSLTNASTGESIHFSFNEARTVLQVDGTSAGFGRKEVKADEIRYFIDRHMPNGPTPLMYLSEFYYRNVTTDAFGEEPAMRFVSYLIPVVNVPMIVSGVFDVVALPVRLPLRYFRSKRHRAAMLRHQEVANCFRRAFATDENQQVSDSVFNEIKSLF